MGCRKHLDVAFLVELVAFSGGAGICPPPTPPCLIMWLFGVCSVKHNFIVHSSVVYSAYVFCIFAYQRVRRLLLNVCPIDLLSVECTRLQQGFSVGK